MTEGEWWPQASPVSTLPWLLASQHLPPDLGYSCRLACLWLVGVASVEVSGRTGNHPLRGQAVLQEKHICWLSIEGST